MMGNIFDDAPITKVVSIFGFFIGCAFITYVIRTMGYFSVIAPEYLGFFIETDLIMGAIMAMPFVFGASVLVYTIFWIVSILVDHEEKIERITKPVHGVKKYVPKQTKQILMWLFLALLIVAPFVLHGENYIIKAELSIFSVMLTIGWLFQHKLDHDRISPLLAVSCVIVTYTALHDIGKVEAITALNHSKARYSVTAADKQYVNVILLRASSSSVLIKVGGDVILYDRGQVNKIERAADQIEQR